MEAGVRGGVGEGGGAGEEAAVEVRRGGGKTVWRVGGLACGRCYGMGIGEGNEKTLYRFSDFKFSQCMKFIYSVDRGQNGIVGSDSCIFSISYHQHKVEGQQ